MLFPKRFRLVPALFLAMTTAVIADPIVVWPPPDLHGRLVYTVPVPQMAWMNYFQEHLDKKAKAGRVDLIFDGDSITDRWESTGLKVWQAHFADRHPFDAGIGADGIQHALWRLDHGETAGLDPKLIVLMIGTNNIQQYSSEQVAEGIKALVADYQKHFPQAHILLLGIFPRAQLPTDPLRAKLAQANQIIAKLDDGKTVTFLDITAKFLQPDGSISKDMMPDFLHPTEKGYEIWAEAIQPIIDRYCPKSEITTAAAPVSPAAISPAVITWPLPEPPPGTNPVVFPVPDLDWYIHWFNRFQNNLNQVKAGSFDLVFDGDGILENWKTTGQDSWKAHFGAMKALNLALDGPIQNALWRVQHGELEGQNPRLAVLQGGYDNTNQDPAQVAQGIKLFVQEYETRCPNAPILLLGVLPRVADPHNANREWIAKINKILATFDDGKRVTFLDVRAKFLQPDGALITEDFMPDSLNLSAKGCVVLDDAIQPVVDTYFPKPAAK
jgi:lysophospholipase L1-like esterase